MDPTVKQNAEIPKSPPASPSHRPGPEGGSHPGISSQKDTAETLGTGMMCKSTFGTPISHVEDKEAVR